MKIKAVFTLVYFFHLLVIAQPAQPNVTTQQKFDELNLLKATLVSIHPGTYRFNSVEKIERYFADVKLKIGKGISERQYFILLSQLVTRIKCGHTYLNPWNQPKEVVNEYFSKSVLPFLYQVIDRKIIITHNLSEDKDIGPGDEIVSINGVSSSTIIDSLLLVSRSDGNHSTGKKFDNINLVPVDIDTTHFSLFDIFFPLYFQNNFNAANYTVVLKPYQGKLTTTQVKSFSKSQRQKIYVSRFGTIPIREKNWELKFIKSNVAYLRLGDFKTWQWKRDYRNYLDSVFATLRNASVKNLIVDIRGNEGGDDDARNEVLSFILKNPFGCENLSRRLYKFLSIPDSLLPYLKTWDKEFKRPKNREEYTKTADGYYEKKDSHKDCAPNLPKQNRFEGTVYLLINSNNSSTTFTLADIFKQARAGVIVGEPTGGTKQGLNGGQFFFLNLPYSKLEIDIPLIWGAPEKPQPDEGIFPDYVVKTTQKDVSEKIDPQLLYVLSLIN